MNTLVSLFWESTRSVRLITVLVSVLGAIGIYLRSRNPSGDVGLLLQVAPWWVWSSALLYVAAKRYWCLWWSEGCSTVCEKALQAMITCLIAITVWSMLLASAVIVSDFGLSLMILVCNFCETWLLARVFAQHQSCKSK